MTKSKVNIGNKIKLLEDAYENRLTEETIKNLANQIREALILAEKYEECAYITKLEKFQLSSMKADKEKLVRNVGLSDDEMQRLMDLI